MDLIITASHLAHSTGGVPLVFVEDGVIADIGSLESRETPAACG
jgi:hypothetical protein